MVDYRPMVDNIDPLASLQQSYLLVFEQSSWQIQTLRANCQRQQEKAEGILTCLKAWQVSGVPQRPASRQQVAQSRHE